MVQKQKCSQFCDVQGKFFFSILQIKIHSLEQILFFEKIF